MKANDKRFMELVNLSVDGALGAEEAREFGEALEADAGRRALFEEYRLMDAGCVALFERARGQAPSPVVFLEALDPPAGGETGRRRWREPLTLAWASMAAAICLTFALAALKDEAEDGNSGIMASARDELRRQARGMVSFEDVAKVIALDGVRWEDQSLGAGAEASGGAGRHGHSLSLEAAQLKRLAHAAWARSRAFGGNILAEEEEISALELKR
jgi:hypothetical protein